MTAVLDHLGIAVQDPACLRRLFALLGVVGDHREDVPEQGVRAHFLSISPGQTQVELLEVTDPEGTVAKFIQRRGPGIHHISFRVPTGDLDQLCQQIQTEGYRLVYEKPRMGAHRMRINFIHPASAGGVLIELMEPQ